jgi:uncharacterized protein
MVEYRGMRLDLGPGDPDLTPYFAAAGAGKLMLLRCGGCRLLRFPPGPACPWCGALASSWEEVSGRGVIHTYAVVHHVIQPGFSDWKPYVVAIVELDVQRGRPGPDDAIRIPANLVTGALAGEAEENAAINARVDVVFQKLSEDRGLPQWRLTGEPPEGRPWAFGA